MKTALAAMVIALKILKKLNTQFSGNLIVNAVADEETGGKLGTGWCLENVLQPRGIKSDFIVVGEPTQLPPLPKAIILGEKGHLVVKVVTNGKSAHSMVPDMGKNAIYMMSKIIEHLDDLDKFIPKFDPPFSLEKLKKLVGSAFPTEEIFDRIYNEQPLLKSFLTALTQFNKSLNMINGGIKENVIPDYCEAFIDFRLLPGQNSEIILKGLRKLINHIGFEVRDVPTDKNDDVFVSLEIYLDGPGSVWKEYEKSKVLDKFKEIVEMIYKRKPFYCLGPGATDAHYYRNNGYCKNTIVFGPGSATEMHAIDESIEIQDFFDSILVYTLFAYEFLKYKGN